MQRKVKGYDPHKKLGELFTSLTRSFAEKWVPYQNLSIDEGCIALKGSMSFKCYNGSKIDKYHIKSYKVVDSSNNYCLQFDLYVGDFGEHALSKYGKTHDLVMCLCEPYLGASYNIYMDNYYTSPILFYNLSSQQTGATVTCKQNRCGLPTAFKTAQVKKKGDQPTYDNQMKLLKIYDRKAVALLSTISTGEMVPTGKCHWQTKLPMEKPEMIVLYKNSWEELIVMISSFSIQALIVDR